MTKMKEQLKNDFENVLKTELDFQNWIPWFKRDKLSKYRTISYNAFYPLAGCAAHLRASITKIAQLQHSCRNQLGRDCINLSPASYIHGEMI
ncbi:MAG: hypothetical protein OIN83_04100 [Candidatus Methanoperedens sp.]|nr:hypothetical protein [Candidatus Methanoperedens sp.]